MNSKQIFDREFLDIRSKILDVAAALDRIDRAEGSVADDPRMSLISEALDVVASGQANPIRAEKIQLLFSREYDASWKESLSVSSRT